MRTGALVATRPAPAAFWRPEASTVILITLNIRRTRRGFSGRHVVLVRGQTLGSHKVRPGDPGKSGP